MRASVFLLPAVLLCTWVAGAQTPIPPFVGTDSEGFETQTPFVYTTCLDGRIFNGKGDLCTIWRSAAHVTSTSFFFCSVVPHSGAFFTESGYGPYEYTFDTPVQRFGGYFTSNIVIGTAEVDFYDACDMLIGSSTAQTPGCAWQWNGWDAGSGPPFKRIEIFGLNFVGGSHVQMDDMEADFACNAPVIYCTPKTNSQSCLGPSIGFTGTPSASCTGAFNVAARGVLSQKSGLLLYGVNGRQAAPFQCGILCVMAPIRRTPVLQSGGATPCSGVFQIDMNAFAHGLLGGTPLPALTATGTVVDTQFWGRDPGYAPPCNTQLTDALEYTVCW